MCLLTNADDARFVSGDGQIKKNEALGL